MKTVKDITEKELKSIQSGSVNLIYAQVSPNGKRILVHITTGEGIFDPIEVEYSLPFISHLPLVKQVHDSLHVDLGLVPTWSWSVQGAEPFFVIRGEYARKGNYKEVSIQGLHVRGSWHATKLS